MRMRKRQGKNLLERPRDGNRVRSLFFGFMGFATADKNITVGHGDDMAQLLNVLFLLEDLCYGGTQKQNLALASGLDRDRFSPQILTLTGKTDMDAEAGRTLSLRHMGKDRKVDPLFFCRLGKRIAELKPDILVPCTALPNIWGRLWGRLMGVPIIVGTCRGGGAPVRQHERFLWRLTDAIVCNSRALVEAMLDRGVPGTHLAYIPNGVDCEHFYPAKEEERPHTPLILCVARLAKDKDHATLLEAFSRLAQKDPAARLRLVGEGPEEASLRARIASMPDGVANRIDLAGASADPAPHYREASLFAMSSIREGQPNTILEAMSSGLPVCATAVGGIPDLLGAEQGGLLSEPRNAEQLAMNMERMLADADMRNRMGIRNRRFAEESFSFSSMIKNHEDLFGNLWYNKVKTA